MDFEGEFESHVTLRLADVRQADELAAWAAGRGVKFTHILLSRGTMPSQPMLTRQGRGTLEGELAAARDLAEAATADGFVVVRVKVEAAPWNRGVPASDVEAAGHPPSRHFEHHVKLVLPPAADLTGLAAVAGRHGAHLSSNARRTRSDGKQERFVTQRCHAVGRDTAGWRLDALLVDLKRLGHEPAEVDREFVVVDSNAAVDDGWLGR